MSFEKKSEEKFLLYKLQDKMTEKMADLIAKDVMAEMETPSKIEALILDLQKFDFDPRAFRIFSPLGLELTKLNRRVYALTEDNAIHLLIKQTGMDRLIKPIRRISEVTYSLPNPKAKRASPKLDVAFINPFIEGTLQVLKVQCKLNATSMTPILKSTSTLNCQVDIAGIIGITSQNFKGSVALCFPARVFLKLMSQMFGEDCKEINDELKDGAAELTNMIFGHAKKILNEKGHTLEKALPSVIRGPNVKVDHPGSQDTVILPFSIEDDIFFMEIGTDQI